MPSERQDRAICQILLDFVGEGPIELPQYNPNPRIDVACKERCVQVELVIG
jgi:hypothetical protein